VGRSTVGDGQGSGPTEKKKTIVAGEKTEGAEIRPGLDRERKFGILSGKHKRNEKP